ncbi:MAG TPA: hypothetical protein VFI25_02305 [Planctomycetota bacterium]|nr:hypothetical protein [Planctomycetota bacterium]
MLPKFESAITTLRGEAMCRFPGLCPSCGVALVAALCDLEAEIRGEVQTALEVWVERGKLSRDQARRVADRPLDALAYLRRTSRPRRSGLRPGDSTTPP